ncbi:MAG: hypothetical protein RL885_24595 [Planctomycetota bacterium]
MKIISAFAFLLLSAATSSADVTTETVEIGGPKSYGSNGSFDPGTLDDGATEARATYTFQFDSEQNILTLVVDNTSPVIPSVNNPLITKIYFNLPILVQDATLIDQYTGCGDGCTKPDFEFHFDPNVLDDEEQIPANTFGGFSARLRTKHGIVGGIANPLADQIPGHPGDQVIGPVTFVFALTGQLDSFTAKFFAKSFSFARSSEISVNCATKFQGGGPQEAGGIISDSSLDSGDPLFFIEGDPAQDDTLRVILNGDPGFDACMFYSFDEGQTEFPRYGFTLEMANPKELFAFNFKQSSLIEIFVKLPDVPPGLVGTTVRSQFVEVDSGNMDEISVVVSNPNSTELF